MKNRSHFTSFVLVVLLFLTIPALGQEDLVAFTERLYKEANAQYETANENYGRALQTRNADEIEKAEANLRKALDNVRNSARALDLAKKENNEQQDVRPPAPRPNTPTPTQPTNPPSRVVVSPPTTSGDQPPVTSTPGNQLTGNTNSQIDVDCDDQRQGQFDKRICEIADNAAKLGRAEGKIRINVGDSISELTPVIYGQFITASELSVDEATKKFILNAEELRTDKQVGSDSKTKGTTSLVVKGGVPAFLNFAAENGAAVRSIDGTTVTFRFNPFGVLQTLSNPGGFIENYRRGFDSTSKGNSTEFSPNWRNYLSKASIGISFDASREETSPVFTGDEEQISALSFRYEFFNERDPRHPKWAEEWRKFFRTEGTRLIAVITQAETDSIFTRRFQFKNPALQKWLDDTNEALGKLNPNSSVPEIEAVIKQRLGLLPKEELRNDAGFQTALRTITEAAIDYNNKQKELLNKIAKGAVATFDYTNYRNPVEPDTHNLRFILAKGFSLGSEKDSPVMDLTFNASLTFYNKKPAGMDVQRIRDFSFAGQLDVPLGFKPEDSLYGTIFSFAGKYQRLTENVTALDGTVLPNTKGDIWVGQAKLTVPIGRFFGISGLTFPISATFANRTELIRESEVRGNFGVTFDFDKLILSNLLRNFR